MNNSTVKTAVEFGNKVNFSRTETCLYSTTAYTDESALMRFQPYRAGKYTAVDYSNEKRMEAYRKVNKMLGGK